MDPDQIILENVGYSKKKQKGILLIHICCAAQMHPESAQSVDIWISLYHFDLQEHTRDALLLTLVTKGSEQRVKFCL